MPKIQRAKLTAYLVKDESISTVKIFNEPIKGSVKIITEYKVVKDLLDGTSLVEVNLITGKTHQIRAHLAHIGHFIIGDGKYGTNALNKGTGFNKQALCSYRLKFDFTSDADELNYLNGNMPADYNPDVSKKKVHINHEDCEGCGACKAACPAGAIYWGEDGLAEVDHQKCLTCGYCSPVCPVRAVIMY